MRSGGGKVVVHGPTLDPGPCMCSAPTTPSPANGRQLHTEQGEAHNWVQRWNGGGKGVVQGPTLLRTTPGPWTTAHACTVSCPHLTHECSVLPGAAEAINDKPQLSCSPSHMAMQVNNMKTEHHAQLTCPDVQAPEDNGNAAACRAKHSEYMPRPP